MQGREAALRQHLARGEWHLAEALLAPLASPDAAPSVLHVYAVVIARQRRPREALPWFRRTLAQTPRAAATWTELGACLAALRQRGEALEAFGRAVDIDPDQPRAWRLLARQQLDARNWREAADAFRRLARLVPDDEEALMRGYMAASEARLPEAEDLRAAIVARPDLRGAFIDITAGLSRGRLPLRF